jgi:hypothetical protein
MSDYSATFPSQRPVFTADFSNGSKIDPRATFSRASTANVFDGAKHLSSENLLLQSSGFDQVSNWGYTGVGRAGGQTDPTGGTNGFELTENSSTSSHRVYQSANTSGDLAFTVYAKQNSGTRYLTLTLKNANNDWIGATFDLAGGTPDEGSGSSSNFTNASATQTASGNGYYKCVLKGTGSIGEYAYIYLSDNTSRPVGTYGSKTYTGDGSSSIDVAFASLSTTGATDYNATTTQIHRAYASSLVSKANNTGRFEVGIDGQSAGTSLGILVEGQSTNLLNYSEQFDNGYWTKSNTTVTANAAVAPSGELTADLITADQTGGSTSHNCPFAFTSGNTYTLSVFAKAAGYNKLWLYRGNPATWEGVATFELTGSGTVSNVTGSASIESVGNGWYRCSVTGTAGATATTSLLFGLDNGDGTLVYDGDDYSGVLLYGAMMEQASHSSSYLKVEGSTATRAADSLSCVLSDVGYTGGDFTVIAEANMPGDNVGNVVEVGDGTASNRATLQART